MVKSMKQVRLVDLSVEIKGGVGEVPPGNRPWPSRKARSKIQYANHKEGVSRMLKSFPGITPRDLPDGLGWASEEVTLGTHSGTYIDTPWHYHPTSQCIRARTVDEMPLNWAYSDEVVLDMRRKKAGEVILESYAARLTTERTSGNGVPYLRDSHNKLKAVAETYDLVKWLQLNIEFHNFFLSIPGIKCCVK